MQKYTKPYPTIGNVIDAIQYRGCLLYTSGHWTYHMYLHVRDIQLNRSSVYRPFGQLYNTKIICLKMKMYKKSYRIFIHINT